MDPRRGLTATGPMLLLLLMLATGDVRCAQPTIHVVRKLLPPDYEAYVQVLKLALALNEEWSPVWSEKLKAKVVTENHPDPEFCMNLNTEVDLNKDENKQEKNDENNDDEDSNGPAVNTYVIIRKIMDYCSFSGLYVKFGMKLIGASVHCLFNRFAQIDVSAVAAMVDNDTKEEFRQYLRDLVEDYQLIADKLAVVGASLRTLVQLVTFFDDVEKESVTLAAAGNKTKLNAFHAQVKDVAGKLGTRLDIEFEETCAVDEIEWYDTDKEEMVTLKEFKDKSKKKKNNKKKKKNKNKGEDGENPDNKNDKGEEGAKDKKKNKKDDTEKKEDVNVDGGEGEKNEKKKEKAVDNGEEKKKDKGKEKKKEKAEDNGGEKKKDKDTEKKTDKKTDVLGTANEIRLLRRKVFERLLITEMPSHMWKEIFTMNILMKQADIKKVALNAPKPTAKEDSTFDL